MSSHGKESYEGLLCGGSITAEKHILTAAHCTGGENVKDITVRVGDHDREREWNNAGQSVEIPRVRESKPLSCVGSKTNPDTLRIYWNVLIMIIIQISTDMIQILSRLT